MSTAALQPRTSATSPRFTARMAGFFWALTFAAGVLALVLRSRGGAPGTVLAVDLFAAACYIGATLLVYRVLKPVSRSLSLLAACFGIVGCLLGAVAGLFHLRLAGIHFLCFGLQCALIGYLILRSTFLPRFVGALMVFAGLGWLAFSLARLSSAPLVREISPYLMGPGMLGEAVLTLWLLIVGVNVPRWLEQAGAAPERSAA